MPPQGHLCARREHQPFQHPHQRRTRAKVRAASHCKPAAHSRSHYDARYPLFPQTPGITSLIEVDKRYRINTSAFQSSPSPNQKSLLSRPRRDQGRRGPHPHRLTEMTHDAARPKAIHDLLLTRDDADDDLRVCHCMARPAAHLPYTQLTLKTHILLHTPSCATKPGAWAPRS